jgi:tetratricopeptide (TPR) repeat protein
MLGITPPPADIDGQIHELMERHAAIGEPLRRSVVAEHLAAATALEERTRTETDAWESAAKALEEGRQAIAAGRTRDAIGQLEAALRIEPASARAAAELDRCRESAAHQRSISDRAVALLEEGRKAAAAKQWHVVSGFCDDALEIDPGAADAVLLKQQALRALEDDAKRRRLEAERALNRADAHRQKHNFAEAAREIALARESDPCWAARRPTRLPSRAACSRAGSGMRRWPVCDRSTVRHPRHPRRRKSSGWRPNPSGSRPPNDVPRKPVGWSPTPRALSRAVIRSGRSISARGRWRSTPATSRRAR